VYEVEGVGGEGPWLSAVIDLELEVGGDPAGLSRGQICADDFGLRVLVGEVYGPDAFVDGQQESSDLIRDLRRTISSADIEDLLDIRTEWCDVKLAAQKEQEEVMPGNKCYIAVQAILCRSRRT
jgi:hypothetical protein